MGGVRGGILFLNRVPPLRHQERMEARRVFPATTSENRESVRMSQSTTVLSRRSALRAGSLSAASVLLARAISPASAQSIQPVDRGSVSNGSVKFPSIAASSEAGEQDEGPPLAPKDRVGFAVLARTIVSRANPACLRTVQKMQSDGVGVRLSGKT
jgi:hypothetical protein